jgi:hypothetical protein
VLSRSEHVVDGSGELVRPGARDDDGVSPAMGFLGNAKESAPIVLAEFHVEVLPLDLDLLRFDNIIHAERSVAKRGRLGKQKVCLKFNQPKGPYFASVSITSGASGEGVSDLVVDQQPQNQFVA